jgi:hypothetical protein
MSEKVLCDFCGNEIVFDINPDRRAAERCAVTIRKGGEQMLAKDACSDCAERIRRILTLGAKRLEPIVDSLTVR